MYSVDDINVYEPCEVEEYIIKAGVLNKCKNNKKITYYNAPIAFDIETTSFEQSSQLDLEKRATMYIWTLSINDIIMQGRTWEEFINVIDFMIEWYQTNVYNRLIIYVHNLAYEFQFLHKYFEWDNVFALKKRCPIRALTKNGIEFRCSYKLSGYSLANLGKNLTKYKVQKLEGDLDYKLIRNCKTKLTDKELMYCINDVLVVSAYIKEYLERVNYIYDIPMTKTGVVRKVMRGKCFYNGGRRKENLEQYNTYRKMIKKLTLDVEIYKVLKEAFSGGFTHASALYSGTILRNVNSQDFTSSYPAVIVSEKFPMSKFTRYKLKDEEEFNKMLDALACIIKLRFINLRPKILYENYLSESHCRHIKNSIVNNGRIVSADSLETTITEQDYFIIEDFYDWDEIQILEFYYAYKGYLPTPFVDGVLKFYEDKTMLKDVEGEEVNYLLSKENVNSTFGMCVTDICREEIEYSPVDWTAKVPEMEKTIQKDNNSRNRFLYYPWGVWITAYARRNLFTAIKSLGLDYVYSDTDSVKYLHKEDHIQYFETYNKIIKYKLKKAMEYHKMDINRVSPKTIEGKVKTLGVWDDEGEYTRFKTLGAKRYMTEKYNKKGELEINITVSGLNKQKAVPYLKETYGDKIFENFCNELYIPKGKTGKQTHSYIDYEFEGYLTDYQGNTAYYKELSAIHLCEADYSLSITQAYMDYIFGIQDLEF